MDIRKTLLWAIFTISALLLFNAWQEQTGQGSLFSKSAAPVKEQVAATDNGAKDLPKPSGSTLIAPAQPSTPKTGELLTLKNDLLELEVDTLGGVVSKARLLKHLEEDKSPVLLFDRSNDRQYFARTGLVSGSGAELPNHTQIFTATKNQANNSITLVAEKNGVRLEKTYTLSNGSYVVEAKHHIKNVSAQNLDATLYAELVRDGGKPSFKGKVEESSFYSTFTGPAVYTDAEKFHKIDFSDIEKGKSKVPSTQPAGETAWVAMVQHYFASAWIPSDKIVRDVYVGKVEQNLFRIGLQTPIGQLAPGSSYVENNRLFIGPQEETLLEKIAPGFDLIKDYGYLTVIAKPIFWFLEKIHSYVANWGWAIVILTFIIKLIFFPLSAASYKSMARMKEVQPRLMNLREQFKGDPQKLNRAMMDLYKQEKINPLGGCLPVLVQIPVFIALYWVLLSSVEMRNAPWILWIKDLSVPDPYFILPVIMAISMFVQTKLNPTPPDPLQAKIMLWMPIIFSVMFFFFPAGLVLYWVVNNILSIAQQWQINQMFSKRATN